MLLHNMMSRFPEVVGLVVVTAVEGVDAVCVEVVGTSGMNGVISLSDMSWAVATDMGMNRRPT